MSDSTRSFLVIAAIILIALSVTRFVFEIAQCLLLRWNYVKDWENWMEMALYICSIVFAWVFHTECLCPFEWQWQVGVVSMFLGWITLLVFVQKFPNTGIYVLMFLSICYTFLKAVILFALLVLAFSLTFYMVFYEPQFQVSFWGFSLSINLHTEFNFVKEPTLPNRMCVYDLFLFRGLHSHLLVEPFWRQWQWLLGTLILIHCSVCHQMESGTQTVISLFPPSL